MTELFRALNQGKNKFLKKNYNIFENAKNISLDELEKFINIISDEAKKQECNQFLKNFDNFYNTEIELEKALYESVFEYKIITIYIIMQNKTEYENNKKHCKNIKIKTLFHGTQPENIPKILTENFNSSYRDALFGNGNYFTDSFDYVTFYSRNERRNPNNFTIIPKVFESFSFITSEVYYDETKEILVYCDENLNNVKNRKIEKYEIRNGKVNGDTKLLSREEIKDESKFIANEFVVHYKEQILPIYGISIMRCEYLIIWRDYNFDETNPNNYEKEVFKKMIKFNEEIKKFSYREVDSKVYYVKTSEEGLNLIRRKKYNKIILITNWNNDAREIIGCDCFVLVSAYNPMIHISWVSEIKNCLISDNEEFHKRFIRNIIRFNIDELINLKNDIEDYYQNEYDNPDISFDNFDSEFPEYPNFIEEGKFIDLTF